MKKSAGERPAALLPSIDTVIEGNCLKILEQFPDRCVDVIFADPPYNLQLQGDLWRPNQTRVDGVDESWDQFSSFEAYDEFSRAWLSACWRVLKDNGTLWVIGSYHNIFRLGRLLQDLEFWILNDVVWIKTNPMPNFRGVRFTNAHETLIWAQKKKNARYTFNHHNLKSLNDDLQMRSDWYLPLCTGKERLKVNGEKAHPTQKPEALLYRILAACSNPGDLILDPFFGTGTTGVAAKRLGRHFIGIEKETEYVRLARQRLQAISQPDLAVDWLIEGVKIRSPRLPFGSLVEAGLIQPGQQLWFDRDKNLAATVLADSRLSLNGKTASIHMLGRELLHAPCNGWLHWYYLDPESGDLQPIDRLRQDYLANAARR